MSLASRSRSFKHCMICRQTQQSPTTTLTYSPSIVNTPSINLYPPTLTSTLRHLLASRFRTQHIPSYQLSCPTTQLSTRTGSSTRRPSSHSSPSLKQMTGLCHGNRATSASPITGIAALLVSSTNTAPNLSPKTYFK